MATFPLDFVRDPEIHEMLSWSDPKVSLDFSKYSNGYYSLAVHLKSSEEIDDELLQEILDFVANKLKEYFGDLVEIRTRICSKRQYSDHYHGIIDFDLEIPDEYMEEVFGVFATLIRQFELDIDIKMEEDDSFSSFITFRVEEEEVDKIMETVRYLEECGVLEIEDIYPPHLGLFHVLVRI